MNIKFTRNNFLQNFIESRYKNNPRTNSDQESRVLHFPTPVEKRKYGNDRKNNTESLGSADMFVEEKYTHEDCDNKACDCSYGKQNIGINMAQGIHLEENNTSKCNSPQKCRPHYRGCTQRKI